MNKETVLPEPPQICGGPHPTLPSQRIELFDILRGFAIFGILTVNMSLYNSPIYLYATSIKMWPGAFDQAAQWLIRFFFEGKFYTLLSFLFGLGVALQMSRAEAQGRPFAPFYRRRLFVLLLLGGIHVILLWPGDILVPYALLGFFLLLFRNRKPKTILIWAIICLLIPVLLMGLGFLAIEGARSIPQAAESINAQFARQASEYEKLIQQSLRVYGSGTFVEIMRQRLADADFYYLALMFYAPNIFAFFLLGLLAGKQRLFHNLPSHLPFMRRMMWWGLGLGIVGNMVFATARAHANPAEPSLLSFLFTAGQSLGAPAFCFLYIAAFSHLAQNLAWRQRMAPLAAVGRTAVSNYLLQSLICSLIFLNYGLGLYGKVGIAAGLALTIVIFIIQIIVSRFWLKYFLHGPVEWLWRTLSYGRRQPMLLSRMALSDTKVNN